MRRKVLHASSDSQPEAPAKLMSWADIALIGLTVLVMTLKSHKKKSGGGREEELKISAGAANSFNDLTCKDVPPCYFYCRREIKPQYIDQLSDSLLPQ